MKSNNNNNKSSHVAEYELYKRIKLLGEGAFGKAYLVEFLEDKTFWVIKQMTMNTMSEDERRETLKEAKILQALQHPNIVKFKEVYKTKKGKLCIVMEYADGGDLSKKIQEQKERKQYFDESLILDWFTQICLALKHVHDRKIIHRDLKGQNIFLTQSNRVKLGDFGIARVLLKTMDKAQTMVGTPYYLSPEIIENRPYSFKSDIWSLGVILYELCALKPPFNGQSLHFLSLNIVRGKYDPIPNHYSQDMKNLLRAMLQINPDKRPSVHDILKSQIIINRIRQFLSETQKIKEFEHTIIHNQRFVNNNNNQLANVKMVQNEKPCPPHLMKQNSDQGNQQQQQQQPQQPQQQQQQQQPQQQQALQPPPVLQQPLLQPQPPLSKEQLANLPQVKAPPNHHHHHIPQQQQQPQLIKKEERDPRLLIKEPIQVKEPVKVKPLLENKNMNKYDMFAQKPETPGPSLMRKPFLQPAKDQIQQQRVMTPKENNKLNGLQRQPMNNLEFRRQPSAPQVFQKNFQEKEELFIFQEAQRKIQEYRRESQERIKRLESAERLKPDGMERNRIVSVDKKYMNEKQRDADLDFKCPAINDKKGGFNSEAFNQKMKEREQERQRKKHIRDQQNSKMMIDDIGTKRNEIKSPPRSEPLLRMEKHDNSDGRFNEDNFSVQKAQLSGGDHNTDISSQNPSMVNSEAHFSSNNNNNTKSEASTSGSTKEGEKINNLKKQVEVDQKRGAIPTPNKKKIVFRKPNEGSDSQSQSQLHQLPQNPVMMKGNFNNNKRYSHQEVNNDDNKPKVPVKKYNSQDKAEKEPPQNIIIQRAKPKRMINNQSDIVQKNPNRVQTEPGKLRVQRKAQVEEAKQKELSDKIPPSMLIDNNTNPSQLEHMAEEMVEMQNLIDNAHNAVNNLPQMDSYDKNKNYFESPTILGAKGLAMDQRQNQFHSNNNNNDPQLHTVSSVNEEEEQDREDDEEEPDNTEMLPHQLSLIKQMSEEEQESMQFIDQDYNKLRSLRLFLEDMMGKDNFIHAYKVLQKEFLKHSDISMIEQNHGKDGYVKLLPFLSPDMVKKSISLIITLVLMEERL